MEPSEEAKKSIAGIVSKFNEIDDVLFSPAMRRWIVRVHGDFNPDALAALAECPLFERGEIRLYSPYALTLYFKNEED